MYDRFCCAEISHWRNFNTNWNYTMRHSRKQWLRGKETKKHAKTMYHRLLRTSQDMQYTYKISLFLCPFHFQSDLFYPLTVGVKGYCYTWSHLVTHTHIHTYSDRPPAWRISTSPKRLPGHHTKFTRDTHPCPQRHTNLQFQNHNKRVKTCALHHTANRNSWLHFLAGQSTDSWPAQLPLPPTSTLNRPLFRAVRIHGVRCSVSNSTVPCTRTNYPRPSSTVVLQNANVNQSCPSSQSIFLPRRRVE